MRLNYAGGGVISGEARRSSMLRSSSYAGQASFAQNVAGKISETSVEDIVAKRSSSERSLAGGAEVALRLDQG